MISWGRPVDLDSSSKDCRWVMREIVVCGCKWREIMPIKLLNLRRSWLACRLKIEHWTDVFDKIKKNWKRCSSKKGSMNPQLRGPGLRHPKLWRWVCISIVPMLICIKVLLGRGIWRQMDWERKLTVARKLSEIRNSLSVDRKMRLTRKRESRMRLRLGMRGSWTSWGDNSSNCRRREVRSARTKLKNYKVRSEIGSPGLSSHRRNWRINVWS